MKKDKYQGHPGVCQDKEYFVILEKIFYQKIFIQDLAYSRNICTVIEILGSLVTQAPQDDTFSGCPLTTLVFQTNNPSLTSSK